MRQPYYLGFTSGAPINKKYYIYDDFGNRASCGMPKAFAIKLMDKLNVKGFEVMRNREYDEKGFKRVNYY